MISRRGLLRSLPVAGVALCLPGRLLQAAALPASANGPLQKVYVDDIRDAAYGRFDSRLIWDFDCCRDFFERHYIGRHGHPMSPSLREFLRLEARVDQQGAPAARSQAMELLRRIKSVDVREQVSTRVIGALLEMETLKILGATDCHLPVVNVLGKPWDELATQPRALGMPGAARELRLFADQTSYPKCPEPYLHLRLACHDWERAKQGAPGRRGEALAQFQQALPHLTAADRRKVEQGIASLR